MRRLLLFPLAFMVLWAGKCDINKLCPTGMEFVMSDSDSIGYCRCRVGYVPNVPPAIGCYQPQPSPSPTPAPTPEPTPTPLPTPMPTPPPTPTPPPEPSCPRQPECAASGDSSVGIYGCCRMVEKWGDWTGSSRFQGEVDRVLEALVAERGTDVVSDEAEFTATVAKRLRARGLCATTKTESPGGGSDDEVGVRDSTDRSEQFDIVFSNGRVRFGGYVAVCRPARF